MTLPYLLALLLSAALPFVALAETTPAPSASPTPAASQPAANAPEAAELTKLLREFLAGASRDDAAIHDRFWADELIYTGSSGRRISKADIMRDVREESAPKEKKEEEPESAVYTAEDIRVQQYGTTAIVAFRLVGTTQKGGKTEVAHYLNTGTFLKRNGEWRAVAWQATKLPAENQPK